MKETDIRIYKEDDSIIFNSQNDNRVLSNMYHCNIIYDDLKFNSAEHLYQWLKFSDNKNIANAIFKSSSSFDAKKQANQFKLCVNDNFEKEKVNNMLLLLQLKYEQCKPFRNFLKKFNDKNLVEFCYWLKEGDKPYWGTTYNKDNEVYVGTNATGRLMMKIRYDNN